MHREQVRPSKKKSYRTDRMLDIPSKTLIRAVPFPDPIFIKLSSKHEEQKTYKINKVGKLKKPSRVTHDEGKKKITRNMTG